MNKTINNEEFKVADGEFVKVPHEEFNSLNILDSLGLCERLVSLCNELTLMYDYKPNISFFDIEHGGYIPIKCSDHYKNIFIYNQSNIHSDNINTNILKYGVDNISLIEPKKFENETICEIIFVNESFPSHVTDINKYVVIMNKSYIQNLQIENVFYLKNTDLCVCIPDILKTAFIKEFHYFFEDDNVLNYDNLIHYTMIVKNAGDTLEDILTKNLPIIDRWTILDTGSTDNTVNIIKKVLACKKGTLYEEPFINFRDSRNRCLDLAGRDCKFILMLDDTYIIRGTLRSFLDTVRGDQFSYSFSLFILSGDVSYVSNRIIKSDTGLRYKYKIHEVITPVNNVSVIVPIIHSNIFDFRCDYMENRTMDRKLYDIKVLFEELEEDPDDPRALYYLGQTYNILGENELALEYYLKRVNHPVEGFLQEKIDACFEAARKSDFQLGKPWEECEKLYEKSFEMDMTRPDALYFIGIHYYLEAEKGIKVQENKFIAYKYMKKCFEIGYPEHCQYSLKPSLHYYFLPKFLAELSYIQKDFITGFNSSSLFLEKTKIVSFGETPFKDCYNDHDIKTVKSWNDIFNLLLKTLHIPKVVTNTNVNSKPYLVFMADGGFSNWTGRDILNKGMGGSETFTIEISRYIQKSGYFQVVVFCRCSENDVFEGVRYLKLEDFFQFMVQTNVHSCIIGRYSEYLPFVMESPVEYIYMIAHDLDFTGNVIPNDPRLRKIFCLSKWHAEYFTDMYQSLRDIVVPFGYGIDKMGSSFSEINDSKSLTFIYSSFPIRGLLPLLQMWPKILEKYPGAILHIHSDVDGWWCNNMRPAEMSLIKELLEKYKIIKDLDNSIKYHGWTDKKDLSRSWELADIWFYPCTYKETFCHTALEAAISKTFIITTNLAALKDTVGDRGILLDGDFYDTEFQTKALIQVFKNIDDIQLRRDLVNKNYEWVKEMTWESRAQTMLKDHLRPTLKTDYIKPEIQFKNVDTRLNYAGMYNWTNDLPENSMKKFIDTLEYVKWKNSGKQINILEVGTYAGTSVIKILDLLPNSKATVIDTWKNYTENNNGVNVEIMAKIEEDNIEKIEEDNIEKIFYNNIESVGLKDKITVCKGDSSLNMLNMIRTNSDKFDFIYIDGSHKLLDVYADLIISFNLLKKGGVMGMDDYVYNYNSGNILESPFEGVNHFLEKYKTEIKILSKEYRVFIEKL